jgi:hypothetical protein
MKDGLIYMVSISCVCKCMRAKDGIEVLYGLEQKDSPCRALHEAAAKAE